MMRVLEIIISIYFLPLRRFGRKGLEGGILLATLPLAFIIVSIILFSIHLIFPSMFASNWFLKYIVVFGGSYYFTNRLLRKLFISKFELFDSKLKNYGNGLVSIIAILIGLLFYVLTVLVASYSLGFT